MIFDIALFTRPPTSFQYLKDYFHSEHALEFMNIDFSDEGTILFNIFFFADATFTKLCPRFERKRKYKFIRILTFCYKSGFHLNK